MSNKFDYHIKNHVDRHEYDVDPQEIWDGILAKQKPQRKRKIWLFLIPLALGGLMVLLWITNDISPSLNTSTSERQLEIKTSTTSVLDNSAGINTRTEVSSSKKQTSNLMPVDGKESVGRQIDKSIPIDTDVTTTPSRQINKEIVRELLFTNKKISIPYENSIRVNQVAGKNLETLASNNLKPQSELVFLTIAELATTDNNLSFKRPIPTLYLQPSLPESTPKEIKIQSKGRWSAALTGGYGLFNKSIISASNQEEAYQRNETERTVDIFTSNFLLNYDLNPSWTISTGVIYQKAYETFHWSGTYFEDSNGNVISNQEEFTENFNAISYEKVERNIESSYNSYEYIDLPLHVSYHPQLNMKLRTAITASVNANILNTNNGYVVNSQNIPVRLGTVQDEIGIGLRYGLGLSMMLPVSERLGLQLNGLYSFRTNTQRDLTLRYDYQEINLGINYKIN